MKCPACHFEDTRVLESRLSQDGTSVRRRRLCSECNRRFTTYEKEEEFEFQILKRDGRIEPYFAEKARKSMLVACQKRPVSLEKIDRILTEIEQHIQDSGERVVPSAKFGEMILQRLHELDKVAYVRFASVYKDFQEPQEFIRELEGLNPRQT